MLSEIPKSAYRGMALAIKLAMISECPTFKLGAVLIKNKSVVGTGWNWYRKTSPKSSTRNFGIHAEFHCLRGLSLSDTKGSTLYVARLTIQGTLAIAKPCQSCEVLLRTMLIKRAYYTNRRGSIDVMEL